MMAFTAMFASILFHYFVFLRQESHSDVYAEGPVIPHADKAGLKLQQSTCLNFPRVRSQTETQHTCQTFIVMF